MSVIPLPPGLEGRIRQWIRDEVGKLLRSGLLRSASIGEGGLTVRDGYVRTFPPGSDVSPSFFLGRIQNAVDKSYWGTGMLLQQPDGTDIAEFRTAEGDFGAGRSIARVFDSGGRVVFATDAASGQGLARPYVPGGLYPSRYADWRVSTSADVFETLWSTRMLKQHPQLELGMRASMDTSGSTGELQVLVNGALWGAAQPVGFSQGFFSFGPAPVDGSHMATLDVEVQARRTSTGGAVRVEPWFPPVGRQS